MAHLRLGLKAFIPPVLLGLIRRARPRAVSFAGDYPTWEAAKLDATGYESEEILERVVGATRKVVAGEAAYERDSFVFDRIEYAWPLLASLLQVALESRSLRVIDFGGALGSTWWQNRKYLGRLNGIEVAWRVVEQEHFVSAGNQEFRNGSLSFHRTITEAGEHGVDVVLAASSLCYVAEPKSLIREIEAVRCRYLIIDRLPMSFGDRDRIALQTVAPPIYDASYPVRLFTEKTLLENLLGRWRVIEKWVCDLQPDPSVTCRGFFLELR